MNTTAAVVTATAAPTAYHACQNHHTLPVGVLICTTAFSVLTCLLTINAYWCCTTVVRYHLIRQRSSKTERRCIILHYLVMLPMFELFVIWGPHLNIHVAPNNSSVVVAWLVVLGSVLMLLAFGFWSTRAHLFALQMTQVLQAPAMVFFLVDRAMHSALGVEAIFIFGVLLCVLFEMRERANPAEKIAWKITTQEQQLHRMSYEDEEIDGRDLRSTGVYGERRVFEPDYESGLDSEVMEDYAARRTSGMLMEFMKNMAAMDPRDISDPQKRKQFESLKRQAELYSTAVPVPPVQRATSTSANHRGGGTSGANDLSGSAQLDSRGYRYDVNEDDDF